MITSSSSSSSSSNNKQLYDAELLVSLGALSRRIWILSRAIRSIYANDEEEREGLCEATMSIYLETVRIAKKLNSIEAS
jgi:hypothetical protein